MSAKIYPCLWFDGKAGEAAAFYRDVFEDARITVDTPLVVLFEIYGKKIMGLNGGPMFSINPSISFFVRCKDSAETNRVWDRLSEGGSVLMPIDKYFWSERYGWLKDKYGMTWQVSVVDNAGDPPSLTPSLLFTGKQFGNAGKAIETYTRVFPDSKVEEIFPYPETDLHAGKVMYSSITLDGYKLIAMDGPGEHAYTFNEGVSLVVDTADQEETDYYWDKLLANGGEESRCGWLKDPFGVSWQIVPSKLGELMNSPDTEKAGRAMQAMLQMNKIVIADLERAFNGE